jgi:hypothetical protein
VDVEAEPASRWVGVVHHYGVFRGDARVGWLRRGLERVEHDGEAAILRSLETFVDIAGDGNGRRTVERVVYRLEAPQHLLVISREIESQGRVGSRRAVRNGGRFDVVTSRDGEETTGAVAAFDLLLADELATERLVAGAASADGPAVGAKVTAAALDLARMRPVRRVLSIRDATRDEHGRQRYQVSFATGPDTWSDPVVVDSDGAIVEGALAAGLTIRRMTEEEALSPLGRTSVEVAERIRMDARLGDLRTLRALEVALPQPPDDRPAPFPVTGRQTVRVEDGRLVLRIDVDQDAGPVEEADRESALAPSPGVDSDHPAIRAAVDRILAGTSRPAVRVARLLGFTASHLDDAVVMEEPAASELLRSRRGDCTEHTRLFLALCRAAGIPAREVSGVIWLDDEQRSFGWHAWAEVELTGRWRPVDPTGGITPAHAAHIRIDPAARAAGVLAGARFELVDAVR